MSSTDDSAANSQNSDTSGNVYDFKDSRTSGVVVVTKTWEDSLSNDERPVPNVSISTEKPSKSALGYGITYHGNGLTFANGSKVNNIVVNKSGKIISGQYKELTGSSGWYSDSNCTSKVELNSNGLPMNGVTSDLDLYAKPKTFVLKKGSEFYSLIPSTATSVVFTDETMPTSATLIDVDADGDDSVVAWMDGTTMKVSTQIKGLKVQANPDSSYMFADQKNLKNIELTTLDTQNVTNMSCMFMRCSGLTTLNLSPLDTRNVTKMNGMFSGCGRLTTLNLSSLNTQNVTNMSNMFYHCYSLTALNLDSFNTQKVTNMSKMFCLCSGLTSLNLNSFDASKVKNMKGMFQGCYSLTVLNLDPLNTQNVTDMSRMFDGCSGLTALDLFSLNTRNVTNMSYMFFDCSKLINLSLGDKFAFVGSDYALPSGTWYSADGTAYTSNGESCTIPSNKADTYTRK